jgi:hypothetical protein
MKPSKMILALVVAQVAIAVAQQQGPAVEDGRTEVTVSVKQDSVKVGDSVVVYIVMKNMHKDRYCHHVIGETGKAELNGYKVEVTDSEGNTLPMLKQQRPRGWSYWGQCLDHGKSTSEETDLNRLVDLSKPGAYRIRVSHTDIMTNGIVWSNSITVTISQ